MNTELQVLKDNIRVLLKLEFGTDIEVKDDWHLLYFLCEINRYNLVEELVAAGLDIENVNYSDNSLLI